jgi:hypothetical protein
MKMKGKKTAIISLLLVILGALQGFDLTTIISDPETAGWVMSGIGILMFGLRTITTGPIFTSETKK